MDQYIYNMNTKLNNEKLRREMKKKDVENIKAGLEEASEWLGKK
jgi:hypothetical protein